MVEWLFLAVPWGCLRFVIVVFPDHTHLLFLKFFKRFITNLTWDLNEACVLIVFCHFPCGILDQVWYLIVSIPDHCHLSYFGVVGGIRLYIKIETPWQHGNHLEIL